MVLSLVLRPLPLSPSFLLLTLLAVICSYESNSNIFVTARINNNNSNNNSNSNNNDGNNIDDKTIPRDLSGGTTMTTPIGGLGALWEMEFPAFEFEEIATNNSIENSDWNSKFRLKYTVNDMIEDAMFSATWWTAPNCKAGGMPLEQYGIGYEFEYESDGQPPGDGSSTREFTVAFRSAPSVSENLDVYTEDYSKGDDRRFAVLEVCVRASLKTLSGVEINYVESLLTLTYDFQGGFFVLDSFDVAAPIAQVINLELGDIVKSYFCIPGNKRITQGTVIQICIEPLPSAILDGFRITGVDSLFYEKPTAGLYQDAVINRKQTTTNELTVLFCSVGAVQCIVQTMLYARFYAFEEEIIARGTVTFQFGENDGTIGAVTDDAAVPDCVGMECNNSVADQEALNQVYDDDGIIYIDDKFVDTDDVIIATDPPTIPNRRQLQVQVPRSRRHLQQSQTGIDLNELPAVLPISEFALPLLIYADDGNGTNSNNTNASTKYGLDKRYTPCFLGHCGLSYSLGATIGVGLLLLLNCIVIFIMIRQFPYFQGKRFYIRS